MSLLIFLIILSALVIVHEVGHFSVAKLFGIRVDEFGLGYPPRAKKLFDWRGTAFTLNWLPFGGFVKIFGENPSVEALLPQNEARLPDNSFQTKNRGVQALVLFAGVLFNFLFAWVLISIGLSTGLPAPAGLNLPIENEETVITAVFPDSPAAGAGLKSGDVLVSINNAPVSPEEASELIAGSRGPLQFLVRRGESVLTETLVPSDDILSGRPAVGISMELIGTVNLPIYQAVVQGFKLSYELTLLTAKALGQFTAQVFVGQADLSAITGPVGIVGMVGDVKDLGLNHLMVFTALISINLSLINLLPFPALDGGRLLFVGIEAVTRRRIPSRIFNALNAAGFAFLIFLMILITVRDVRNIF